METLIRKAETVLLALLLGMATLGLTACESQDRFEEAGEELDDASEDVNDAFEELNE